MRPEINTGIKKMLGMLLLAGLLTSFSFPGFAMAEKESDSLRLVLEKTEGPVQQAAVIKQLSMLALAEGDYPLAIEYLNREMELRVVTGDSVSWANAHYNLGMIFSMIRSFDKAIHHSLVALEYFDRSRLYNEVANTCINLGFVYNETRNPDLAYSYYERALKILNELSSKQGLEASYLNLGILSDKSIDQGKERRKFDEAQGGVRKANNASLIVIYTSLGKLNLNKNDLIQAENYLNQALDLAIQMGDQQYEAVIKVALATVYFTSGKKPDAYRLAESGLEMAKGLKIRNVMLEAYAELAKISMGLNQPVLAFSFLDQYSKLKDSIYNEQQAYLLSQAQARFEIGRKELDSERLLRENLEQALKLERNKKSKVALIGVVIFIVILLAFFFKRYYFKTKAVDNLEDKNKLIETQKTELEQLIQTKDRFLSIIAHDLKNPFTSLLGFADLAYNEFDEITDAEKRSYLGIIRQSSQHIYSLLDNLLTWSRAQSGRIDFKPEPVDLSEIVEASIDVVRSMADNKQISLYTDFTRDVIVKADKNMLFTVLRNLLSNAIKFTQNGGSVTVSCNCSGGKAAVSVTDTGIGMNEDELSRLFRIDGNLKNSGTNNETGTGLGLILCQEFMNIHKSKIQAMSTPGKGSTFSFTLEIIPK